MEIFSAKIFISLNFTREEKVLSSDELITVARVVQTDSAFTSAALQPAVSLLASCHLYFLFTTSRFIAFLVEDRSPGFFMPKRTFQPNRRRRSKTHGFRTRMKTKSGRAVISRRRAKGRKRVSVKPGFRE